MDIIFDSRKGSFKTPFGCIKQSETVKINILIKRQLSAETVCLVIESDDKTICNKIELVNLGLEDEYAKYFGEFTLPEIGLYFYHFQMNIQKYVRNIMRNNDNLPVLDNGYKWQITCYKENFSTPNEFKGAVMYQIFPDRFYEHATKKVENKLQPYWIHQNKDDIPHYLPDYKGEILNNDFYGGTLKGIELKLDYLMELGIEIIYLNPIFMAFSNHRYDTADYKTIDPLLGTEEDFIALTIAMHKRSMRLVLDGVFSHTGNNSLYFDRYHAFSDNGAYNDPKSPYREWYSFTEYPNKYESWWGISTLPCTNELNQSFLNYILHNDDSVVKHWLRLGADGFRLDVADELPDEFIRQLNIAVKATKKDAIVIGEVWEDASNKISYGVRRKYFLGNELDSVMNYVYKDAIISFVKGYIKAPQFIQTIMQVVENYPQPVLHCLMNMLGTHDTKRILSELSFDDVSNLSKEQKSKYCITGEKLIEAKRLLRLAYFLLFTLPGMPCIYYGDEIGMQGLEDPFNRGYFTWNNIDKAIQREVKSLIKLKRNPAIRHGNISMSYDDENMVQYERVYKGKRIMCVANAGNYSVFINCQGMSPIHTCNILTTNEVIEIPAKSYGTFTYRG